VPHGLEYRNCRRRNISQTHARAALQIPGVQVAAVYGANPDKVARMAAEHGATPYTDFEKFLAHRPMDFVAIGSPSGLHAEQGIAAARRGLHVLSEKPLDITTARADSLIAATDEAGVKLGVFFQDRFKADLLRSRAGWTRECSASRFWPTPASNGFAPKATTPTLIGAARSISTAAAL
jgi:predicted dehydrogenase